MSTYNLKESLRSYFGFDKFKGSQEEIIENLLDKQNTFVIMPTGGGKSLCYQLPALVLDGAIEHVAKFPADGIILVSSE